MKQARLQLYSASGRFLTRLTCTAVALLIVSMAGAARADECKFIPDKGPLPNSLKGGRPFEGTVWLVLDGDSICVGSSKQPMDLVEVRIADFYAPELRETGGGSAMRTLQKIALKRKVRCIAQRRRPHSYDRVVASCFLRGQSLGDLMRAEGVQEGGRGSQNRPTR